MTNGQRIILLYSVADSPDVEKFYRHSIDRDLDDHYRYLSDDTMINSVTGVVWVTAFDEYSKTTKYIHAPVKLIDQLDRDLINAAKHVVNVITRILEEIDK